MWNCYILILSVRCRLELLVLNKLIKLNPGIYIYLGSSLGSGGALSRILYHLSRKKSGRWHIDKLTMSPCTEVEAFFLVHHVCTDCESDLAELLVTEFDYIPKFGSTDKPKDPSHLFKCNERFEQCAHKVYELISGNLCILDILYVQKM